MSLRLYQQVSEECSKRLTKAYSTSFSIGISLLHGSIRQDIYSIYGFVRLADEIVDTFHSYDKAALLEDFIRQTYEAIDRGISTNLVLQSFQHTVNTYQIDRALIEAFIKSMRMDLDATSYTRSAYEEYIVGSAEVVGLMCLQVFLQGNRKEYERLAPFARRLGAAFQKINFLRDLKMDSQGLGRQYFPQWQKDIPFTDDLKQEILQEIKIDFAEARKGICQLPSNCKTGVYAAYVYYKALLIKIEHTPSNTLLQSRIRISNALKVMLLFYAGINVKMNRVR
jgi:15-cis-phytoene synthase